MDKKLNKSLNLYNNNKNHKMKYQKNIYINKKNTKNKVALLKHNLFVGYFKNLEVNKVEF